MSDPWAKDDPIGTRTEHERTADFPPHARELVRKHYPDGTVREWFRERGGTWTEPASPGRGCERDDLQHHHVTPPAP